MAYYPAQTFMPQNWSETEARNFDWDERYRRWPNAGAAVWRSRTAEAPTIDHDSCPRYRKQGCRPNGREYKPKKYWARPVDRRSHGAWGRLMDVLHGDGPDVFIVVKEHHRSLHSGLSHRTPWSGWEIPEWNVGDWVECGCHRRSLPRNEDSSRDRRWARSRTTYN
jgi:hypothetical protein